MKWGLFGGTFDPIHIGHLRCAEEIRELFQLNRVIFVPASRPPHKLYGEITAFDHRERMVRLAIESNPSFSFSNVESERVGTSYSVETVAYFLGSPVQSLELYFIIGQDAFHAIRTWKEWEKLLLMCHFVVMTRPGYENVGLGRILTPAFADRFAHDPESDGFRGPTGRFIYFRAVTFLDIASRRIRHEVKEGRSTKYLMPDAVRHYIVENGLYRKS
jgi:nicotinate-nucleotide adenylyltransferase